MNEIPFYTIQDRQQLTHKLAALKYIELVQNKAKGNVKLTLTIFCKLFEELPIQIAIIKEALIHKQYDIGSEIVHKLNGSASFCDLEDIRKASDALEDCINHQHYEAAEEQAVILEKLIDNFLNLEHDILANLHDVGCQDIV